MDFTAAKIRDVAHGVRILRLEPPLGAEFSWRAGQYVWLKFGTFAPRAYSIAKAYDSADPAPEFHLRDSGAGGASTYALKKLRPGETVRVSEPEGKSFLDESNNRPLLLVAGGLGIAPLKAIVEASLRRAAAPDVHLFWGARHEADLYMPGYFETLAATHRNFRFHPAIGDPVGECAVGSFEDLKDFSVFLAGPEAMIAATVPLLLQKGAEMAHIHYDSPLQIAGHEGTRPARFAD
jgi:NAD(P)H-flavin reductase